MDLRKRWKKLRDRYKLTILNESTYEEVMSMRLTRLRVLTVLSVLIVVLVVLTTILIAFTNLREYIPGYPDGKMRHQMTMNSLRVDSLMMEMEKKDRFFRSIRFIMTGDSLELDTTINMTRRMPGATYDSLSMGVSDVEMDFRQAIEERERFNLSFGELTPSSNDFYHLFPPVAGGVITNRFDESIRHYGIDLVTKSNSNVFSVLDGVVVFSDWTVNTGYVIQVQHSGNMISIYKHNSILYKKQGDVVRTGEVIAVVGNTGEETTGPHLHFELWRSGKAMDPELYINLK